MWRDSMPPGLPVFGGVAVEDLSRAGRPGFVLRASEDGALVLADEGAQWVAHVSDVRMNLDERSGLIGAVHALGPMDCNADDWHRWLIKLAADDIDDELRSAIADACADALSAQVARTEENERRLAEDKARREANMRDFGAIGDKLFGGGVDYDWQTVMIDVAPGSPVGEIKRAVDDITCAGCLDARGRAKEAPARCETCGQEWA